MHNYYVIEVLSQVQVNCNSSYWLFCLSCNLLVCQITRHKPYSKPHYIPKVDAVPTIFKRPSLGESACGEGTSGKRVTGTDDSAPKAKRIRTAYEKREKHRVGLGFYTMMNGPATMTTINLHSRLLKKCWKLQQLKTRTSQAFKK